MFVCRGSELPQWGGGTEKGNKLVSDSREDDCTTTACKDGEGVRTQMSQVGWTVIRFHGQVIK